MFAKCFEDNDTPQFMSGGALWLEDQTRNTISNGTQFGLPLRREW